MEKGSKIMPLLLLCYQRTDLMECSSLPPNDKAYIYNFAASTMIGNHWTPRTMQACRCRAAKQQADEIDQCRVDAHRHTTAHSLLFFNAFDGKRKGIKCKCKCFAHKVYAKQLVSAGIDRCLLLSKDY